ncbi:hypothetical protein V6Z11_A04G138200 [Gossypium hirsutum]
MPKPSIALKVRLRPTKQSPPTVRARRAMSPSPSLLSFSSCCGSEWKGTIDHVSNVARWMSARRGRARDVRCLGTASIAAAEGNLTLTHCIFRGIGTRLRSAPLLLRKMRSVIFSLLPYCLRG